MSLVYRISVVYTENPRTITKVWPFALLLQCVFQICVLQRIILIVLFFLLTAAASCKKSFKCGLEEMRGIIAFFQEAFFLFLELHLVKITVLLLFNILEI